MSDDRSKVKPTPFELGSGPVPNSLVILGGRIVSKKTGREVEFVDVPDGTNVNVIKNDEINRLLDDHQKETKQNERSMKWLLFWLAVVSLISIIQSLSK